MASSNDNSVPKQLSELHLDQNESEVLIVSKGSPHRHHHRHSSENKDDCDQERKERSCSPKREHCHARKERSCSPPPQKDHYVHEGLFQFSSGSPIPLIELDGAAPVVPIAVNPLLAPSGLSSAFPLVLGAGSAAFVPTAAYFLSPVPLTDPVTGQFTVPAGTMVAAGFSYPIPYRGRLRNLEVSSDILPIPLALPEAPAVLPSLNTLGLEFDFTVFIANSNPNNGVDHASSPYLLSTLTSSVRFGAPTNTTLVNAVPRTATNLNCGSIIVNPGDRIGVRVRTNSATDASALELAAASFSATLGYERLVSC
jgi:hypothetical protein